VCLELLRTVVLRLDRAEKFGQRGAILGGADELEVIRFGRQRQSDLEAHGHLHHYTGERVARRDGWRRRYSLRPGKQLRRQIEASEGRAVDPRRKAWIPFVEPPLGVPILEQFDLGAAGPTEPAHHPLDRREQIFRQCDHPASPGLTLRGREAFLHVNRAKEFSLVGGQTYRLLGGAHVSLEKQP